MFECVGNLFLFGALITEIQEEAKAALGKAQEETKKYTDRKRGKRDGTKIGIDGKIPWDEET